MKQVIDSSKIILKHMIAEKNESFKKDVESNELIVSEKQSCVLG